METNHDHIPATTTTSSSSSSTLATDDPRTTLAAAVAVAGGVIAATTPDQFDLPTPCTDFDVRTLLGHLVAVLGRVAVVGRHEPALSVPSIVTGIADDGWSSAWQDAAHGVQAVWQDAALLDDTFVLPWATKSGVDLLLGYASEVSVHTWDLAKATGQSPAWDDEVLEAAYTGALAALPPRDRRLGFEAIRAQLPPQLRDVPPPFGEPIAVPEGSPVIDRLVAWNGRAPGWQP